MVVERKSRLFDIVDVQWRGGACYVRTRTADACSFGNCLDGVVGSVGTVRCLRDHCLPYSDGISVV